MDCDLVIFAWVVPSERSLFVGVAVEMFELVPGRTDVVEESLSDLQLSQMHAVFEGDKRILRIIQFLEYDISKLILLEHLYFDQHLLITPPVGSQHNNNLLKSLGLNRC